MQTRHRLAAVAIALAITCAPSARAQIETCFGGLMSGVISYGIATSRNSPPFTATIKTTFEQTLAEGNAIHRVTRTHQARDSAGRTRQETAEGCELGPDGEIREQLNVNVNDPAAKTSMNWQVGRDDLPRVVHVFHFANLTPPPRPPALDPNSDDAAQRQKMLQASQARAQQLRKEQVVEKLGTRDFNGVSAQGTRTTRTIPIGEEGNDLPLVLINEIWRSNEFGVVLMAINDDPRRGRITTEYEELDRGEPDPALFAPPPDYKIAEQPQPGVVTPAN
jgi:hypothetical protein